MQTDPEHGNIIDLVNKYLYTTPNQYLHKLVCFWTTNV